MRNPIQIAQKLAKGLEVGAVLGMKRNPTGMHLPRTLGGYYTQNLGFVATRNAANFGTNIHVMDHATLEQNGMTPTADMVQNVDPAFAASYSQDRLGVKAYAEFVRQH